MSSLLTNEFWCSLVDELWFIFIIVMIKLMNLVNRSYYLNKKYFIIRFHWNWFSFNHDVVSLLRAQFVTKKKTHDTTKQLFFYTFDNIYIHITTTFDTCNLTSTKFTRFLLFNYSSIHPKLPISSSTILAFLGAVVVAIVNIPLPRRKWTIEQRSTYQS